MMFNNVLLLSFLFIAGNIAAETVDLQCQIVGDKCKIKSVTGDFFNKHVVINSSGTQPRKIQIEYVSLGRLPESLITDHPNVEELELKSCYISSLDGVSSLKKLRKLEISYNGITEIGEHHFDNPVLYELDLDYNKIDNIHPNAFKNAPNLKKVDLSHNNLTKIGHDVFSGLNEIDLSYNLLSDVHGICSGNGNLTELSLDGNKLSKIDAETFAGCTNLRKLDIRLNPIVEVDANVFQSLKSIRKFKYDQALDKNVV